MPEKTGLPVVLIPGFMLDASLWDDFEQACAGEHPFIRVELAPGNSISEIAAHIAARLPERFILAGFSLGGYIARAIVEQHPARVAALILIASSDREDTPQQQQSKRAAVAAIPSGDFRGLSSAAVAGSLHPERAADKVLVNKIREMGKRLGSDAFRVQSSLIRQHITRTAIRCPSLVIAARQDRLRSEEEARELQQMIAGAELALVDQCGHMIPLEQPAKLAHIIMAWLRKTGC